jgi:pyruvate,water dikinase
MSATVVPFADLGMGDVAIAGGKGASLGELLRAGVRVPDGFVVTTSAFRDALARLDPGGALGSQLATLDPDDGAGIAAVSAQLRELIRSAPLPGELAEAVSTGYRSLCADTSERDLPVAVRSSATGEDSAEASYAGLQDTYLWVRGGADVLEQIRHCWASLYSVEAVTYRLRRGLHEAAAPAMATVVQRMLDARSSGVMFTRSPLTGDRSVVCIDASWGLGSAVVGGDVTPDSFVASKVTGEVTKRTVATKAVWHQPDESGSGVRQSPVPEQLRDRPSVSDAEIAELVTIARTVEAHYGSPQDIEWAISESAPADANVFLLQSRPETTHNEQRAAIAKPAARAFDHVANMLSGRGTAAGNQ